LALILRNTPDSKNAIPLFNRCFAIREKLGDKSSDEYKDELAGCTEAALNCGDTSTAEEIISRLIPIATEYEVKHKLKFELVECYTRAKNFARAEHLMLETVKQNESVGQCYSTEMLGVAQWYSSQKRYDEAKPWFLKAIAKGKQEGDKTGVKKAQRELDRFFVKENKKVDVAALLKKSPPEIALSDNSAKFELGGAGGLGYQSGCLEASATKVEDGKQAEDGKKVPEKLDAWVMEYREALKQLNQKHYMQAEFQFKAGTQKYKSGSEQLMFTIGLAKTYQEMKEQQKLRETIVAMVKSQENAGVPNLKPINSAAASAGKTASSLSTAGKKSSEPTASGKSTLEAAASPKKALDTARSSKTAAGSTRLRSHSKAKH